MKYDTKKQIEKAFLVGVIFSKKEDVNSQLEELARLAHTSGVEVVGEDYQLIREVTPATLIGSGKLEEIKKQVEELNANLVIVDAELSGSQTKNLSDFLEVKVIDRITLILDIFAMRAMTNEGKLQVELAQLKYNLPRLSSIEGTSGRFGSGGVGMRGPGEAKLELDRRIVKDKIVKLQNEIAKIKNQRQLNRKERVKSGKYRVCLVGYTNAGKSTMLNTLARENIYADDKLFATLDTTSRKIWLSPNVEIILTDTVGFINKLPHSLVDAFSSTLEETKEADLILHIIDISNPHYVQQKEVVEGVLNDLKVTAPVINVYNKCDMIEISDKDENAIYMSAKKKIGVDELKNKIINTFSK